MLISVFIIAADMMPEVVIPVKVQNQIYVTECTGLSTPPDFQVDWVEAAISSHDFV